MVSICFQVREEYFEEGVTDKHPSHSLGGPWLGSQASRHVMITTGGGL